MKRTTSIFLSLCSVFSFVPPLEAQEWNSGLDINSRNKNHRYVFTARYRSSHFKSIIAPVSCGCGNHIVTFKN